MVIRIILEFHQLRFPGIPGNCKRFLAFFGSDRQTERQADKKSDRQTERKTGRQKVRQADRKSEGQKSRVAREPALVISHMSPLVGVNFTL